MEIITFELIRKVQKDEKDSPLLSKLPEGFFDSARSWLSSKQKFKDNLSLLEIENGKKLIEEIINRRTRKIVTAALDTLRGGVPPENMLAEELKIFDQVLNILKNYQENIKGIAIGYDNIAEEKINDVKRAVEELKSSKDGLTIKMLTEVPSIIAQEDLQNYGPFKTGEVAKLPKDTANILLMRKMADLYEIS